MPEQDAVTVLTRRGVSFLWVAQQTWEGLTAGRHGDRQFSRTFPHAVARSARPGSLTIIGINDGYPALFVALARSVLSVSTLESRVSFGLVRPVAPYSLRDLIGEEESPVDPVIFQLGGVVEADFERLPEGFARLLTTRLVSDPDNARALRPIIDYLGRPDRYVDARAMQQDAVDLALKVFGAPSTEASSLALSGPETALERMRIQEDAAIGHDARWMPGWRLADSDLTGRAVFRTQADELQVFTANREALEDLFGVDLIYLNERRGSLVMVQYKMMEPIHRAGAGERQGPGAGEREWMVRIDDDFRGQMQQMSYFDCDLEPDGPYRLNCGAFYFKLVKRNADRRSSGIMLSLEHIHQLIDRGAVSGPRGGLRIRYGDLDGHYLRGEAWVELVRSGYVGTRGATTAHLEPLIQEAMECGRAAVAAINRRLRGG